MRSLLITGCPASGKSRAALDRFLSHPTALFVTPTATMAEHLRNELARAALPIRPNRILTLSKFIEPFTPFAQAPDSLLALVGQVTDLSQTASEAVEEHLAILNVATREKRIGAATPHITAPVIFDGFYTITPSELEFIEKLAQQTSVTVTLPTWPGSAEARTRLLEVGFEEQAFPHPLRRPLTTIQAALSLEQEVENIARTILERHAQGREFREMGVLLRARDPYASALETAFARLGIPARFHFTAALSAHPVIQYLTGMVRAHLSGWEDADLVKLLRMPVSGLGATPEGDALDFALRKSIPSRTCPQPVLDVSKTEARTPSAWSSSLNSLRNLIPQPQITDHAGRDQIQIWRSTAAALNAFERVLEITAQALAPEPILLENFFPQVETALTIEKLRIPDRRRNVVNVLDVYEARQWELPIAFIPGLNERVFPQYHRDDRQHEEQFLFALAASRATEETILSYARFNEKGDPQLRSFFLHDAGDLANPTRVLPAPQPPQNLDLPSVNLTILHPRLTPTSLETFLQCPFQFFAQRTLKLRKAPDKPRDRLNNLVQGSILHRALAEGDLDSIFDEECQKNNIPQTYRTEAVRLELRRHFDAFRANENWPLHWFSYTEEKFELALNPQLTISGRIDRLDIGPGKEAIVIDYKYSAAAKIRERVESDPLQAGLYLLAAERYFKLHPAGMFYCGLRQSVSWEGWHASVPGLNIGERITSSGLHDLMKAAENKAIEAFQSIASGNIDVRPKDRSKCRYCDFNAVCRVESIPRASHA